MANGNAIERSPRGVLFESPSVSSAARSLPSVPVCQGIVAITTTTATAIDPDAPAKTQRALCLNRLHLQIQNFYRSECRYYSTLRSLTFRLGYSNTDNGAGTGAAQAKLFIFSPQPQDQNQEFQSV